MTVSLKQYAKEHSRRPGPSCSVCVLPPNLLEQVTKSRVEDGTSLTIITEWLITQGFEGMNRKRLEHHFIQSHHMRKPK